MIYVTAQTKIMLAVKPADFRKQIDGLISVCSHLLKQNSRSGTLFVFINRSRTMIRVLSYDGSGYWLATKRLSKGSYTGWPTSGAVIETMAAQNLLRLIKTNLSQSDDKPETNQCEVLPSITCKTKP